MSAAYLVVKLLHILLAIAALGANFTYGVWFFRANRNAAFAPVALRGIKFIDDRIANPAYLLMLPTGVLMAHLGGYPLSTRWIAAAMSLWGIAMLAAYLGYTPVLRAQIAAVDRDGIASPAARALGVRGGIWAALLAVLVLAILVLMVFKPT